MSKVQLSGNANGTGIFTIASPNSNTDRTLNLPDAAGTLQVSGNPISGTTGTFSGTISGGSTIGVGNATPSTSGAGITFPATQSASSDANTLDDYEEGTFTPTINFGGGTTGITYSSQVGRYVKIGRVVTFNLYLRLSNKGSSSGALNVTNLPFTSQNVTDGYNACTLWINSTNSSVPGVIQGYVAPNSTNVPFERFNSGFYGTLGSMTNADLNNTSDIMVGGIYIVG